jgi:predicted transcriptional regulator
MKRRAPAAPLSEAEWKVMNAVWEAGAGAVPARTVCDALARETGWAYTTVKTLMDRLVEKGVLAVEIKRHVAWYSPRLRRSEAVSTAAEALARRAFGGAVAPLVHHLLQARRLSAADRAELRRMLDDADAAAPGRAKE